MKKLCLLIVLCFAIYYGHSQESSDGTYALPEKITQRPDAFLGFPSVDESALLENFKNPPRGYGEVPFYWWTGGEELTKERLLWQLDQLSEASVLGLNVSYNHTHKVADSVANKGKDVLFGVSEPSNPEFMSDAWWEIWNWFSEECGKRDMGLGLDDYVVGHRGAGYWADQVDKELLAADYQGKLLVDEPVKVKGGAKFTKEVSAKTITLTAYPVINGRYDYRKAVNLLELADDDKINWQAPSGFDWEIIGIETTKGYMIHPEHGNTLLKHYYQVFEDKLSPEARKGMNFFFQDELKVDIDDYVWSEDFASIFKEKKGYDIQPYLPALYMDIGAITPKIRLDYSDVMVELVELRYFKPIFEWHWKRGLLFGCDNWGRGLEPERYGDYFRATRWFSAPGNDAPRRGYSFIQTKVSSSVAHLYKRPRVWLEAYHSMGWNARPSQIHFSTNKHYQFGANLMCLHGLYYSTHGGWWEWAPPDFHFRMPYWPHFKHWLRSTERLSYLLSQGKHVCDVAIMYPVAPLQAKNGGDKTEAFTTGEILFNSGMDFDFMDFQSLNRAVVKDKKFAVSDESYQVLVLADMSAIHFSTLEKALEMFEKGGTVVGAGKLPLASDRIGSNDPEVDRIIKTIFGYSASEAANLTEPHINQKEGVGIYFPTASDNMAEVISPYIERDFYAENGKGSVLHRKIGDKDLFMVMDLPGGSTCFFRASGKPVLLNAESGDYEDLKVLEHADDGTVLRLPRGIDEANLILFTPGKPGIEKEDTGPEAFAELVIDGYWESEFVPTLDNRWGDFRNPASGDTIGIEARHFAYQLSGDDTGWKDITYSYGPRFWRLHCKEADAAEVLKQITDNEDLKWETYDYSLRFGVEDNPGSQGYHGLKYKVSDNFLLMPETGTYFFKTYIHCESKSKAEIEISGREPDAIYVNGKKKKSRKLVLKEGVNPVLLMYSGIEKKDFHNHWEVVDWRERSAVVFKRAGTVMEADDFLSMKWYRQDGILDYDVYGNNKLIGNYRFTAPPGMRSMQFDAYGNVKVYQDGKELQAEKARTCDTRGLHSYEVLINEVKKDFSEIRFEIEHMAGYYGGGAFPEPVKINCERGTIKTGDWSKMGVLKAYSGGLWYRKNIKLKKEQIESNITLDLGEIGATAEIHINGKFAGYCIHKPFEIDIRDFMKEGDNYFEILVYSTLANHYSTIPTPPIYRESYDAGLIGPVKLVWNTCREGARKKPIDVYLIGGQSNATGQGYMVNIPGEFTIDTTVLFFYSEGLGGGSVAMQWGPLCQASETPDKFGVELSMGGALKKQYPGQEIALIKHALSGSNLYAQWNPGSANDDRLNFGPEYSKFVHTVEEALKGLRALGYAPTIRAMVWQQGEGDARDIAGMENSRAYGQNLRHFIERVREQFHSPDMLFVYGYVIPVPLDRFTGREEVRTAQRNLDQGSGHPMALRGAFVVETDDLPLRSDEPNSPYPDDRVHFNTFGILELGNRFAEKIIEETK
jgi:hypothetical protein